MEAIARAVDHPSYGILLHIGHWEDGDPDAGDSRLARCAVHTHLDAETTRTRSRLAEKMQLLLDAGYTGCWGVEHHSAQNEYAEIAIQIAAVRGALARIVWERQLAQTNLQNQMPEANPLLTAEQEGRL
jgi:hypothetical protein